MMTDILTYSIQAQSAIERMVFMQNLSEDTNYQEVDRKYLIERLRAIKSKCEIEIERITEL